MGGGCDIRQTKAMLFVISAPFIIGSLVVGITRLLVIVHLPVIATLASFGGVMIGPAVALYHTVKISRRVYSVVLAFVLYPVLVYASFYCSLYITGAWFHDSL
jgi:hypothetical protein